jgi:hypothetical protein
MQPQSLEQDVTSHVHVPAREDRSVTPAAQESHSVADLSPVDSLEPDSDQHLTESPQLPMITNPVFEKEPSEASVTPEHPPSQIPRCTSRCNKGVPAAKPYDRYLHVFSSAQKVVSFQ